MAGARTKEAAAGDGTAVRAIRPSDAQKVHANKRTLAAIALFDAMVEHQLLDLFPPDLPPATVRQLLVDELAASQELASAGAAQKAAVAKRDGDDKVAKKLLRRVTQLVDSAYPNGSAPRADFFPAGANDTSLASRLEAMAKGLGEHGLPKVPADISVAGLVATAHGVAHDASERDEAGVSVKSVAGAKRGLKLRSTSVRSRLVKALRGYYGEDSAELTKFGLVPIVRHGPTRRRKLTDEEKVARKASRDAKKAEQKAARAAKKKTVTPPNG